MARSTRAIKKRLVKPTHADAQILLRLVELEQSDCMLKAENWLWNELSAKDFQEFQRQYPEGSEGYNHCMAISSFWETVGVLLYYKLINENLLFDRFVVEPYWERLEFIFQGIREAYKEPDIAENFEWLAKRAAKWDKSHKPKI